MRRYNSARRCHSAAPHLSPLPRGERVGVRGMEIPPKVSQTARCGEGDKDLLDLLREAGRGMEEKMKKMLMVVAVVSMFWFTGCVDEGVHAEGLGDLPTHDGQLPILGFRVTNETRDTVYIRYIITELRRLDDNSAVSSCSVFDCSTFTVYQDGRMGTRGAPSAGGNCLLEIPINWDGVGDDSPFGAISVGGSIEFVYTTMIRSDAPPGRYQYTLTGYWIDEFDVVMSCDVENQPTPTLPGVPIVGPVLIVL